MAADVYWILNEMIDGALVFYLYSWSRCKMFLSLWNSVYYFSRKTFSFLFRWAATQEHKTSQGIVYLTCTKHLKWSLEPWYVILWINKMSKENELLGKKSFKNYGHLKYDDYFTIFLSSRNFKPEKLFPRLARSKAEGWGKNF